MTSSESSESVLVLGATGAQGGAVADALLDLGAGVRAMVRRPESDRARRLAARGVEVVPGDLDDVSSLAAAMKGAAAAFAVTTPFESGPEAEIAQGRAIVDAASRSALPSLLFSSVAGADRHSGVPHFESKAVIEQLLAANGVRHAVLAPTYFFDNALGGLDELRDGQLVLPLPGDRPLQQVARTDLGAVAARMLRAPERFVGRRVELAGDEPTPRSMATELSEVLGRPVRHVEFSPDQIDNPDMRAMWEFFERAGYAADLPGLRAEFPDVAWTSFADWARATFGA